MAGNTEDFNEDELESPEWMNADFFTTVLNHYENDSQVQVKGFKISPASMKGDHYASVMFRAKVEYNIKGESKEKSLIMKVMPQVEGQKKEILEQTKIFETEIGMYTEVIPKFEKMLREIGDDTILGTPCIYHSLTPRKMIIFEDLVPHGYTTIRSREMTYEEEICAYTKLAKWHAISYKILQEDPSHYDEYHNGIFSKKESIENPAFRDCIKYFVEFIDSEPSLAQYKKYFEPLQNTVIGKCHESFISYQTQPRENFFYVLCHGDFHMKNVMVKHNQKTGELEDLMLLDFQLCYVGPIHNDLVYGFNMMLNEDSRLNKVDEILFKYHEVFKNTLQKLNFEGTIPSLVDIRHQMVTDKYFELFLVTFFLAMWLKFREGEVDIGRMIQDPEYQKTFFRNPRYLAEVQKLLPRYLHRGYFEDEA